MLVDSHAHLEMPQFEADREAMLARARVAGVGLILAIGSGTGPGSLDCAIQLARLPNQFEEYDREKRVFHTKLPTIPLIRATIGIHPHEAKLAEEKDFAELEQLAKDPTVIAWGEIGLDYFYNHSPRDVQQKIFMRQMEMARSAKLPIIIHCRPSENSEDAWQDCLRLIREHWVAASLGGVLHCFTGSVAHMRTALEMDFMISFAGNVTFPKAQNIRDAAREVPLDRMLIETDSPFLAPVPHRGKRNEPAFVAEVAKKVAEIRGLDPAQVADATTNNFSSFFKSAIPK